MLRLKNLDLCLWFNGIQAEGTNSLAKAVVRLSVLEQFKLNLRSNAIQEKDVDELINSVQ